MHCPHCSKSIHFQIDKDMGFHIHSDPNTVVGFEGGFCPSCLNLIVRYYERDHNTTPVTNNNLKVVYPFVGNIAYLSEDIPKEYLDDYDEAALAITFSPKASAALSRRCLQRFFHSHLKIEKNNLAQEIDEFIKVQQAPSYILQAVDAIRNIGNFAAHPIKNTNTGEIVDVEPGEAEWLLEVLQLLFQDSGHSS